MPGFSFNTWSVDYYRGSCPSLLAITGGCHHSLKMHYRRPLKDTLMFSFILLVGLHLFRIHWFYLHWILPLIFFSFFSLLFLVWWQHLSVFGGYYLGAISISVLMVAPIDTQETIWCQGLNLLLNTQVFSL